MASIDVHLRLPPALHRQLNTFAAEDCRSLGGELMWLTGLYVAWRAGKTTKVHGAAHEAAPAAKIWGPAERGSTTASPTSDTATPQQRLTRKQLQAIRAVIHKPGVMPVGWDDMPAPPDHENFADVPPHLDDMPPPSLDELAELGDDADVPAGVSAVECEREMKRRRVAVAELLHAEAEAQFQSKVTAASKAGVQLPGLKRPRRG